MKPDNRDKNHFTHLPVDDKLQSRLEAHLEQWMDMFPGENPLEYIKMENGVMTFRNPKNKGTTHG